MCSSHALLIWRCWSSLSGFARSTPVTCAPAAKPSGVTVIVLMIGFPRTTQKGKPIIWSFARPVSRRPSCRLAPRNEHRDLLAVAAIIIAEHVHEIALLEQDADDDVGRQDSGQQQMALGQHRCRPQCDDE